MTAPLQPGDSFTWSVSGISYLTDPDLSGGERVSRRGEVCTVTAKLIEANADRNGDSFLSILHDEDAQLARYGRVIAVPGVAELTEWQPGTLEQEWARDAALLVAHAEPDEAKRVAAVAEVRRRFGRNDNPSSQFSKPLASPAERDRYLKSVGLTGDPAAAKMLGV